MGRIILFFVLVAVVGLALITVIILLRVLATSAAEVSRAGRGVDVPMGKTFSTIAYLLLLALMFGVVTGWLGAV
ncbi:hypothetical protein EU803_03885 [Loktanella sp. IMCC34160]|uniref:hypothetical protein n=1 Tax=Loktanella sp. IMCC34160 TaxID=2510646 RepID=UPI00101C2A41|nr:hypothetical protein [Loktanella sp. IMCC34160]RYG93254.1 hypothetical protein EU803_03885 [Loktanella sp. IMCC34160]